MHLKITNLGRCLSISKYKTFNFSLDKYGKDQSPAVNILAFPHFPTGVFFFCLGPDLHNNALHPQRKALKTWMCSD